MNSGIERIAAERNRQISSEGWTPERDDIHDDGSLSMAAACYAFPMKITVSGDYGEATEIDIDNEMPLGWPASWDTDWWKPDEDPIRNLEKAGALIAAEIDRLLRARSK